MSDSQAIYLHFILLPVENLSAAGASQGIGGGMSASQHLNGTVVSQGSNNNTANLKGKLQALEEMILQLADELQYHKKEVQVLRSEKETLESVLTMKTQDVRKTLTNENFKVEEEMKRHYSHQKAENSRI